MSDSNPRKGDYLLGSADNEIARLWRQHQAWQSRGEEILAATDFAPGMELLDLGCGPGFTSRRLAELVGPTGSVTGVDLSPRFEHVFSDGKTLLGPEVGQLQFVHADVERLDRSLGERKFDGAFARWLFCFLSDPAVVAAGVRGYLKSGAQLVVHDYSRYLEVGFLPDDPILARGFEAVYASFKASGGNLDIGDSLPQILEKHGYRVEATLPIQVQAGPGEDHWRWFEDFYQTHFSSLVDGGFLSAEELEAFDEVLTQRRREPTSIFKAPPMVGIIARAV